MRFKCFSKRKICSLLLTVCLLVSCLAIFASARDSQTFSACDATIEACQDGSLKVNEKWTVNYKGSYDSMTRSIETNSDNSALSYGEITDVVVKVGGKEFTRADSELDGTFSADKSKDGKSVDIFIHSKALDETKVYDISYTVTKAIKKDGNKARIAFTFLGESFAGACNNVNVTVKLPSAVVANDIVVNDELGSFFTKKDDSGTVTYYANSVYEDFIIDFAVPSSDFDVSKLAKISSVKDFFVKFLKVLEIVVPVIAFIAVVILVFVFVLMKDIQKRRKIEKSLVKQLDEMPKDAVLPDDVSTCEAYKMLTPYNKINPKQTSKKIPVVFAMTVLECLQNGYIVNDKNTLKLNGVDDKIPDYQRSCLNFLKEFATDDGKLNDVFYRNVKQECESSYDRVVNYLISFYNLIPDVNSKFFKSPENVAKYEKVYLVKHSALQAKGANSFTSCIEKLLTGSTTESPEVFAILFDKHKTQELFDKSPSSPVSFVSAALGEMNRIFIPKK